ncbi:MAG TPA: MFS transporter [Candidatus Aminicenantes bacterium]|nr:MFS transporter [Candidatus Aminicenantes bacterium]
MTEDSMPLEAQTEARPGNFRWTICALLFFATTINYIDRQILGILAPELQKIIGWSEVEYGNIVTAFQTAYALGLLLFGRFIDRYGTRIGYSIAILVWSVAAMAHAAARTAFGFGIARFTLGLGEAGNFPSAIKAVAEWFPKKERALATGIFNAGCNVGAVIAPAVVPWVTVTFGWPAAFLATGAIGFIWVLFWILLYDVPEKKKRLSQKELAHILSDPAEPAPEKIGWLRLLKYKQTWAIVIGKFLTDPIWWFYLYWLGKFLNARFGLTLIKLGLPLIAVYALADVGSVGGGWLSSALIKKGGTVSRSRKTVMLACALCVVPVMAANQVSGLWSAVLLIGLAAGAHQAWSANIFTFASDMFPKKAVGSVTGLGGMAGAIGGMLFSTLAGHILEWTKSYFILFIISGSAYLLALGIIQVLAPRLEPVNWGHHT